MPSIFLPAVTIDKIYNNNFKTIGLLTHALCIYKILVEQGNPFPSDLDAKRHMLLLMTAMLLVRLVICNAFKSENVYSIVLPRVQISYYNVDELIEDDITVCTQINHFPYLNDVYVNLGCGDSNVKKYEVKYCIKFGYWVIGFTELDKTENRDILPGIYLKNNNIWERASKSSRFDKRTDRLFK